MLKTDNLRLKWWL